MRDDADTIAGPVSVVERMDFACDRRVERADRFSLRDNGSTEMEWNPRAGSIPRREASRMIDHRHHLAWHRERRATKLERRIEFERVTADERSAWKERLHRSHDALGPRRVARRRRVHGFEHGDYVGARTQRRHMAPHRCTSN